MTENKDLLSYRRSLVIEPKTSSQFNQFLPSRDKASGYVPAPLRKKRVERQDENRRSLGDPLQDDDDSTFSRSKSLSDIVADPNILRQVRYEEIEKIRDRMKETEDRWQDDLTKWKNRRRSVNSDIVKKKEEREKIESITSSGSNRRSKTFREMQEDRMSRGDSPLAGSEFFFASEDISSLEPPIRAPLARSYTVDNPYSSYRPKSPSMPFTKDQNNSSEDDAFELPKRPTEKSVQKQHVNVASTKVTPAATSYSAPSSQPGSISTSTFKRSSPIPESYGITPTHELPSKIQSTISADPKVQLREKKSSGTSSGSTEAKPGMTQAPASLPKAYPRSDSLRLSSVIAPRPFGTQPTRISSLPRSYTMDDAYKRYNGYISSNTKSPQPNKVQVSEDESSSVKSSSEEEEEEDENQASDSNTQHEMNKITLVSSLSSAPDTSPGYSDMRISLNQKPNSSQDFGFQTNWDSTGARIKSIQKGSPAELCHLQVGDEILRVNTRQVSEMSYSEWKSGMEAALKDGNLVMDVRRHGKNNWDTERPSLPYKSHKTINLTSMDPTLVGPTEIPIGTTRDFSSVPSTENVTRGAESRSQPVTDLATKGMNGGFLAGSVAMRNKEAEPISLKNLKRRSEFFGQPGGPEVQVPDVQVPPISTSHARWSWDPEEERRRQEKWLKEQERLLQEKHKRDQEKLQEQWHREQQEAEVESFTSHTEMSIQPPWKDSGYTEQDEGLAESQWEKEEKLRKESEEKLKRLEEEEKRRVRDAEKERQRQEAERKAIEEEELRRKRKQQEEEERRRRQEEEQRLDAERRAREEEEEEMRWQRKREEEERRRRQEAAEQKRREAEKAREAERAREQRSAENYRFNDISAPDRAKSKSTPELDDLGTSARDNGLTKGSWSSDTQKEPLSQAQLERQQILKEMRKKTQLLTDNSWIRQSSPALQRESIDMPGLMRRGESLDNLEDSRSWRQPWSTGSTSSLTGLTSSYNRLESSGPRSVSPLPPPPSRKQEPAADPNRPISGKKICTLCDEPLGKGAAMIIESLGLCYHLHCFKCVDCEVNLGGSEAGAEVRIRNKQLYCNSCHDRIKVGLPFSM